MGLEDRDYMRARRGKGAGSARRGPNRNTGYIDEDWNVLKAIIVINLLVFVWQNISPAFRLWTRRAALWAL